MQFLGLASVAAILGVAGISAASTLRHRAPEVNQSAGNVTNPASQQAPVTPPVVQQSLTPAPAPVAAAAQPTAEPTRPTAGVSFALVTGRTQLSDSVYAVRSGDSVTVNFDAYGYRTRRSSKFETTLRATLPHVYGKSATASLNALSGEIVTSGDVVGALARDGMRFTLDNGVAIRIQVLTRVVRDGPIAIGYVTTVER
jgi:hypothetical protein